MGLQVILLDDLIDKCRPGDNVDIRLVAYLYLIVKENIRIKIRLNITIFSGIVIRKWSTLKVGHRAEATTFLMANNISIHKKISEATFSTVEIRDTFTAYWEHYKDNVLAGRDNILASICPQVYLIF